MSDATQNTLFPMREYSKVNILTGGRLSVQECPDGRRLLRFESGTKDNAWLELSAEDAQWVAAQLTREGAQHNA